MSTFGFVLTLLSIAGGVIAGIALANWMNERDMKRLYAQHKRDAEAIYAKYRKAGHER